MVELLVVVAIIGILAAAHMVVINPIKRIGDAKDVTSENNISQMASALETCFVDNQFYLLYAAHMITASSISSNTIYINQC